MGNAIRYALNQGSVPRVYCTDGRLPINNGLTPLGYAVSARNLESVRSLLERDASIDADNNYGFSAIHVATAIGQDEILTLLFDHTGDVDSKTDNGSTPLHYAIMRNKPDTVRFLFSRGTDVHLGFEGGYLPIHVAAATAGKEIGTILLEAGVEIDVYNGGNQTPLHLAAKCGNTEMVEFLLEQYTNDNTDNEPDESSDSDEPSLYFRMAGTINKTKNEKIKAILDNPDNRRWCCAVDVWQVKENTEHHLFRSHHAGAVLLCVGNAVDEKSFRELVKRFMYNNGVVDFKVMACCESPVGSLGKDMEQGNTDSPCCCFIGIYGSRKE